MDRVEFINALNQIEKEKGIDKVTKINTRKVVHRKPTPTTL